MGEDKEKSGGTQGTIKLGLWLSFLAFLLIVIVFKDKISNIQFGSEGVKASMVSAQQVQEMAPEERKKSEEDLLARARTQEKQAQSQPVTEYTNSTGKSFQASTRSSPQDAEEDPQPARFTVPNLSGNWIGATGIPYRIDQQGNFVTVREVTYGVVTAAASGRITGQTFALQAATLVGTSGTMTLTISEDGNLQGQYNDAVTGMTVPLQLTRYGN